ncbi:MAG: ATP-binding cassette domain-containing protein [Crocinitomix sp.]|nr:ATP-binding cassette domain-containing protein [Crocinitomix sp.]
MLKINLHKTFKTRQRTAEIHCKAQFDLGVTSAIYGKSGIGKSTVLRMIAGLEKADSGLIQFQDEVWFDEAKKTNYPVATRNIGFVFQDFNLFPNMTVEGNLKYASHSGKDISKETKHLMEVMGLNELFKSRPQELSGGERQRVSIVRALCQNPKLLLLDEPFSALDDESIGDLMREIKVIQKEIGTTVLLVSHRKDVILEMADSVVHMQNGQTVIQGLPQEILTKRF